MIHHWYGMFIVMELCFCFRNLKGNENYTLMTCVDGVISNKSRSTRIPLWNAYRMIIRADRFRVALYLLPPNENDRRYTPNKNNRHYTTHRFIQLSIVAQPYRNHYSSVLSPSSPLFLSHIP